MLDEYAISAIRQSFASVQMRTPVDALFSRGNAVRQRRRIPAASLATLVACGGVLIGLGYGPSGATHDRKPSTATASSLPKITLQAWTVKRAAGGIVSVTIREMTDIPGLQAALQADGVPAIVTDSLAIPPGCTSFEAGQYKMGEVVTTANPSGLPSEGGVELLIRPALVPQGALLWLGLAQTGAPQGSQGPAGPTATGYFTKAPSCFDN